MLANLPYDVASLRLRLWAVSLGDVARRLGAA